nr:MAG TPA: hypothetical protein [Caudoviricetes sp.]DAO09463.1 MAG TPA: hypothetical protein [Caudoviricetes sp.]
MFLVNSFNMGKHKNLNQPALSFLYTYITY